MVKHVPNMLTALRILMIPLFVCVFYIPNMIGALVIFAMASITDFFDGYIARRYHVISTFGKLMDPLADKLMLLAAMICLYTVGLMPRAILLIMAVKELLMVAGGIFLYRRKVVVYSKFVGKAATWIFYVGICMMFLHQTFQPFDVILLYTGLILNLIAFVQYGLDAFVIKKEYKEGPGAQEATRGTGPEKLPDQAGTDDINNK